MSKLFYFFKPVSQICIWVPVLCLCHFDLGLRLLYLSLHDTTLVQRPYAVGLVSIIKRVDNLLDIDCLRMWIDFPLLRVMLKHRCWWIYCCTKEWWRDLDCDLLCIVASLVISFVSYLRDKRSAATDCWPWDCLLCL